jgi:hypothetical protein
MSETPKISGYLGCLDALSEDWPLVECLEALSACCSEVVVVDGGSTDGSIEALEAAAARHPWLKLHRQPLGEGAGPGSDGRGKLDLLARARSLCRGDYCWLIVPGEVLADDALGRLQLLLRHWPAGVTAIALPCIELLGGCETVHVREAAGRTRLSLNHPALTHDVPRLRRRFDASGQLCPDPTLDADQLVDRLTYEPVHASSLVAASVQQLWHDARSAGTTGRLAKAWLQAELNRMLDEVPCIFDLGAAARPSDAEHVLRCGKLPPAALEEWLSTRIEAGLAAAGAS